MFGLFVALLTSWVGYNLTGTVLFNQPEDQPRSSKPLTIIGPIALVACLAAFVTGLVRFTWWQPIVLAVGAFLVAGVLNRVLRRNVYLPGIAIIVAIAGTVSAIAWIAFGP